MADFRTAVLITLEHEGGFQNDYNDRANWTGGEIGVGELVGTKYGITTLDMPGADIKNLTTDQAVDYYAEHYWKSNWSQIENQDIANKLFDMGVLFGIEESSKCLERALGTDVDGVIGMNDISYIDQTCDSPENAFALLKKFKAELASLALQIVTAKPAEREFFTGWIARINS